jgi:hypothetical protein
VVLRFFVARLHEFRWKSYKRNAARAVFAVVPDAKQMRRNRLETESLPEIETSLLRKTNHREKKRSTPSFS